MSQYKLIIFDFDGTLAMTREAIVFCMVKTFAYFNVTQPAAEIIRGTIGLSLANTFKILHPAILETAIPQWIETYRFYYRTEGEKIIALFPGTKDFILSAVKSGLNLVIYSNKQENMINLLLESLQIRKFFYSIVGDNGKNKPKPDPSAFYSVIQPLFADLDNSQILMVGDTEVDLMFAKNAGIDVCWVACGYGNRDECLALKPNFTIDRISELAAIVKI
jgi:phosphoglycolate phosphatase